MNMDMEIERWETDERMQTLLVAILEIAGGQRTVLTHYREINRVSGMRVAHIIQTLKQLRHDGVLAIRTGGFGTQVTFLRKLSIESIEPATMRQQ